MPETVIDHGCIGVGRLYIEYEWEYRGAEHEYEHEHEHEYEHEYQGARKT